MKHVQVLHRRKWPPTESKKGKIAHKNTNELEKQKFGKKDFHTLFKLGQSLPPNELLGHVSKSGNITVSKKVPLKLRKEVKYHEEQEYKMYKI